MNYRELRASDPQGTWETWMRAVLKVARFVLLLLTIPVVYVLCDNPMDKQAAMRGKLEQLQGERDVLKSDRDKLLRRMEWIKNDNDYLEMAARDRLHLQKEGEYILRFE
ncbi:FtsB family cell division protein [Prosthecobacter sp.]|jgi:cell division protein FtsB|nr:septum formation initiator family protein [Verrucomicrobiaceae bacterium]